MSVLFLGLRFYALVSGSSGTVLVFFRVIAVLLGVITVVFGVARHCANYFFGGRLWEYAFSRVDRLYFV